MKFKVCRNVVNKGDWWGLLLNDEFPRGVFQSLGELKVLNRNAYSSILEYNRERSLSLKLIRPQTNPRDSLRKYFRSQAKREFTASLALQSIGIYTPAVFGYAYSLSPFSRYESILFMEYKEKTLNGFEFLTGTRESGLRKDYFKKVAGDINTMYKNRLHHRDCNFGNILVDDSMNLHWIDNDVKTVKNTKDLHEYVGETLQRLRKTYTRGLLTDAEWKYFTSLLLL